MKAIDFPVFLQLLSQVHQKAFNEPLAKLPYGKSQLLSYLIFEKTGQMLSYKTLCNYVSAALSQNPEKINPNLATMGILAQFALEIPQIHSFSMVWYQFRQQSQAYHTQ